MSLWTRRWAPLTVVLAMYVILAGCAPQRLAVISRVGHRLVIHDGDVDREFVATRPLSQTVVVVAQNEEAVSFPYMTGGLLVVPPDIYDAHRRHAHHQSGELSPYFRHLMVLSSTPGMAERLQGLKMGQRVRLDGYVLHYEKRFLKSTGSVFGLDPSVGTEFIYLTGVAVF